MLGVGLNDAFLTLVRLGAGHSVYSFPDGFDWPLIHDLAERHGLLAIVLEGIEKLPDNQRPPQELLLQWIGEGLKEYELRYGEYKTAIKNLSEFYEKHGLELMVLKGYGLSLYYPKPHIRPCGDIDIWVFGKQKKADALVASEKGIKIDTAHHHHTVFEWEGFSVENHYDFLNVYYGHRNDELEKILKSQAYDDSHSVEVEGQRVYLPNANLHALFILRHAMHNFASTSMNLRQVLDWAFFVEKQNSGIDWGWLLGVLKEYKMMEFFNTINAVCVEDLGFPSSIFPIVRFNPSLKARVLADIITPEFSGESPRWFFSRIAFKYRRWQANAWKQDFCYGDSRWKAFWAGVWSHILKPSMV